MNILILAAGYATRLHPLTLNTSKSLLPVGGQPIIDIILGKSRNLENVNRICVVTNNKFFAKFKEWAAASAYKDKLVVVNDGTNTNETRCGAIRDLQIAIDECRINEDLLVMAGDNIFEFDLKDFIDFALQKDGHMALALYDVKDMEAAKRYGVLSIDKNGKILNFEEKPKVPKSTLASTGIYFFPKKTLAAIKDFLGKEIKGADAPGYYISWASKQYDVYGYSFSGVWYDIGDIESYKKADAEYSKKERAVYGKK